MNKPETRAAPVKRQPPTNERVLCGCGCGLPMNKYSDRGRPRKFIRGHNWTQNWMGQR